MYQYSLNGGTWTNFTSGQTISNLVPNTTYTMQIRLRKSYNQVWGYSEVLFNTLPVLEDEENFETDTLPPTDSEV